MDRLEEILRNKRAEIEQLKSRAKEFALQAQARTDFRSFQEALVRHDDKLAVIAEVKKASPSAGVISESFEPVAIARSYESAGASAISVLTDVKFFQGALEHLVNVRSAVSLPILRKDFILDEIQITESVAAGADAILLIVAALDQKQLIDLGVVASAYRLDVLVEVHSRSELERALAAEAKIVGINNRNLATFEVDLAMTEQLCRGVPDDVVLVSESGIKTPEDVARIKACGVDAILVGKALMRGDLSLDQLQT